MLGCPPPLFCGGTRVACPTASNWNVLYIVVLGDPSIPQGTEPAQGPSRSHSIWGWGSTTPPTAQPALTLGNPPPTPSPTHTQVDLKPTNGMDAFQCRAEEVCCGPTQRQIGRTNQSLTLTTRPLGGPLPKSRQHPAVCWHSTGMCSGSPSVSARPPRPPLEALMSGAQCRGADPLGRGSARCTRGAQGAGRTRRTEAAHSRNADPRSRS